MFYGMPWKFRVEVVVYMYSPMTARMVQKDSKTMSEAIFMVRDLFYFANRAINDRSGTPVTVTVSDVWMYGMKK